MIVLSPLCSYFGEIVRTHGPLDPADVQILEPLNFLPEDRKAKISQAGGIAKLLVDSGHFAVQGKLICPVEEMGVVAASMNADSASRRQLSEEGMANVGHDSKKDKTSQASSKKPGGGGTNTPSPFAQKSSLSGLLTTVRVGPKNDYHHHKDLISKTKAEEAGSKRNTSALAPKVSGGGLEQNSPGAAKREVEDVIRRAHLRKQSEEKQREVEREMKRVSSKDTGSSDRESRAASKDSKQSGKESKSSATRSKDKDSGSASKYAGSSVKDSGSLDEKMRAGKDLGGSSSSSSSSVKDSRSSDEKLSRGFDKVSAKVRKGELMVEPQRSSRASSKDSSSRSGSSSESRGGGRVGGEEARRDVFSPTNSSSSMSSSESSSGVAMPAIPPTAVAAKKSKKAKKGRSKGEEVPVPSKPVPSDTEVRYVTAMIQTDPPLVTDKWVMTDPLPPVDSFRERYENAIKEKKDLQEKLERSEDQRFKLQKTHKREVEQLLKQTKLDAKEVEFGVGWVWSCGRGESGVFM